MTIEEKKELILWLRSQGAAQLSVQETSLSVVFHPKAYEVPASLRPDPGDVREDSKDDPEKRINEMFERGR